MVITLVPGTRDWSPSNDIANSRWWQSQSPFTQMWHHQGFTRHGFEWAGSEIPQWGTVLSGTFWSDRTHRTWWRGAFGQASDLAQLPLQDRNLICHSHGGNLGVLVEHLLRTRGFGGLNSLTTICTPNRRDMASYYHGVACPWLAVYNTNIVTNRMQWMGARGNRWKMPEATNVNLKCIGHSRLIREPYQFAEHHHDILMPFIKKAGQ